MKTRKYMKYGLAGVSLTVIMLLSVAFIKNDNKEFAGNSSRIIMKSSERNYNKNFSEGVSGSTKVVVPKKDDKSNVQQIPKADPNENISLGQL